VFVKEPELHDKFLYKKRIVRCNLSFLAGYVGA